MTYYNQYTIGPASRKVNIYPLPYQWPDGRVFACIMFYSSCLLVFMQHELLLKNDCFLLVGDAAYQGYGLSDFKQYFECFPYMNMGESLQD